MVKTKVDGKTGTKSERGYKIHCPFCGYQWVPRIEAPKECPECKRYIRKARMNME